MGRARPGPRGGDERVEGPSGYEGPRPRLHGRRGQRPGEAGTSGRSSRSTGKRSTKPSTPRTSRWGSPLREDVRGPFGGSGLELRENVGPEDLIPLIALFDWGAAPPHDARRGPVHRPLEGLRHEDHVGLRGGSTSSEKAPRHRCAAAGAAGTVRLTVANPKGHEGRRADRAGRRARGRRAARADRPRRGPGRRDGAARERVAWRDPRPPLGVRRRRGLRRDAPLARLRGARGVHGRPHRDGRRRRGANAPSAWPDAVRCRPALAPRRRPLRAGEGRAGRGRAARRRLRGRDRVAHVGLRRRGAAGDERAPTHRYEKAGAYTVILDGAGPAARRARPARSPSRRRSLPSRTWSSRATRSAWTRRSSSRTSRAAPSTPRPWTFGRDPAVVVDYRSAGGAQARAVRRLFVASGETTVALEVRGPGGASRKERTIRVVDRFVAPKAAFEASAAEGVAPFSVTFTNRSTGSARRFRWDFGDGTPALEQTGLQDTTHEFRAVGSFVYSAHGGGAEQFPPDATEQTVPPPTSWPRRSGDPPVDPGGPPRPRAPPPPGEEGEACGRDARGVPRLPGGKLLVKARDAAGGSVFRSAPAPRTRCSTSRRRPCPGAGTARSRPSCRRRRLPRRRPRGEALLAHAEAREKKVDRVELVANRDVDKARMIGDSPARARAGRSPRRAAMALEGHRRGARGEDRRHPRRQVAAQDRTVPPMLLVGIGGTGAQVLRRVKRRARWLGIGDLCRFLVLDMDDVAHGVRRRRVRPPGPRAREERVPPPARAREECRWGST